MADVSSHPGVITGKIIEAMIQAKVLVTAEQVAEAYKMVYATVRQRASIPSEAWEEVT
jgi:hypothetical protein